MSHAITSMEGLAQKITNARISSGLTQFELAERAGVCERTVQRLEAGDFQSLPTMWKLLDALELKLSFNLESKI